MYLSESQVNDYEENCLVNSNLSKHPTQAQSLKQFKTLGDKSSSINKKLFSISSEASPKWKLSSKKLLQCPVWRPRGVASHRKAQLRHVGLHQGDLVSQESTRSLT